MKFNLESLEFVECDIDIDKLAVSGSDKDLTWGEFKEEVEKQKEKILAYNLPTGHPVIIYGHKEVEFVVSMVACMSLKMPYIPVDTIYPEERLVKISRIVNSAIEINTINSTITINQNNLSTTYERDDQIIYIIFTSGSTGEPKGVQITKGSIFDFKDWLEHDFNFDNKNVFMNQAPFSFDLSVYEVMGFLLFGGTIILNSRESIQNHIQYFERLKKYQCNLWVSTPSFISKLLLSEKFNFKYLENLQTFLFCGETLTSMNAKKILRNFPNAKVINSYGPTEATVATTQIHITQGIIEKYAKNLPVGYVKENTAIKILNKDKDNIGEIQIIGNNVSIGYFNNTILNQEKFRLIDNIRSFRTGDYGYMEDDMLFFSNRRDELIKLHGFRIEIGEIDKEIESVENIQDSITIPLKRGNEVMKLITFIISESNINIEVLKDTISKKIPYYMIPSDIVQLENFPYNSNHKIDKKKLIEIYRGL